MFSGVYEVGLEQLPLFYFLYQSRHKSFALQDRGPAEDTWYNMQICRNMHGYDMVEHTTGFSNHTVSVVYGNHRNC